MTSKLETKGVRVFLGNIPFEATEQDLMSICELAGRVVEFRFVMDNKRGRHKGTGFCEYPDVDTAQAAIRNLGKFPLKGRELIVDWADNEMKSKQSLSKILTLDQFDQVGNRISGLMKRSEQEVQKIDPQDCSLLGEVAQVVHNCSCSQLLYVLSELQRMAHLSPDGTKKWLKENALVAHAVQHMCFVVGISDDSLLLRDANKKTFGALSLNPEKDDMNNVFTMNEEEILKSRSKKLREKLWGKEFQPISKKEVNLSFLRKLEKLDQAQIFDYLRNLKPEEVAALPTELQLQAQAVRASQKDSHEDERLYNRNKRDREQYGGGGQQHERGGGNHGGPHQQHRGHGRDGGGNMNNRDNYGGGGQHHHNRDPRGNRDNNWDGPGGAGDRQHGNNPNYINKGGGGGNNYGPNYNRGGGGGDRDNYGGGHQNRGPGGGGDHRGDNYGHQHSNRGNKGGGGHHQHNRGKGGGGGNQNHPYGGGGGGHRGTGSNAIGFHDLQGY
ncbi:unnamed protein product [Amoebophrya sp. A120]|nr:unnamed protein product [Amoebophrya sp. A120]|eukprot:GSA120T00014005001.1